MVTKQKTAEEQATAAGNGLFDSELAQAVKESAQQIWLAGMGAFAKAQAEGGKVFEALVKEGTGLQRKTQAAAEGRFGDVAGKVTAMADEVSAKAGQQWDKLESIFEQRVDKALGRLGVPSAQDLQALLARIDALEAQVTALSRPAQRTKRSPAAGAKAGSPAARRTAQAGGKTAAKAGAARRTARKTDAG